MLDERNQGIEHLWRDIIKDYMEIGQLIRSNCQKFGISKGASHYCLFRSKKNK